LSLKLVATSGTQSLTVHAGRTLLAGRSPTCDLPVRDLTVSRRHAELALEDGGVRIRDLGSTNGTFLDGDRVTDALAAAGSRIAFGKAVFEVREDQLAANAFDLAGEAPLDATILRQVEVRRPGDLAARLAGAPAGPSRLRLGVQSPGDRQAAKLALLLDIVRELAQQTDLDRLLEKVARLILQVLTADRVAILTLGPAGELVPRVSKSRSGAPLSAHSAVPRAGGGGGARGARAAAGGWHVPRSVARKAVAERVAVLIENAPTEGPLAGAAPSQPSVQSALCAPMIGGQGMVLGLIYLDAEGKGQVFGEEDLEFLTAFSGLVAVAIENSQLIERAQREAVVLSNFQRYFAPYLAEQIASQEGQVRLGGSKRRVVVLFSDIRGFTALSAELSPDEIALLLTEYFTEMVEIVFRHGGTLDKFMGDAVMALWGAPLAHEDDADRAVAAAISMQRALESLNEEWKSQGRRTLSVGIGINVGEVFAGNIGSDRRLDYTVIGDAVNIAAHLCAEAGPGDILAGEPLIAALRTSQTIEPLPERTLKGKSQAVPVFRIRWERGSGAPAEALEAPRNPAAPADL
jgi:adenylate cyclase